jgi:hypothetical protein
MGGRGVTVTVTMGQVSSARQAPAFGVPSVLWFGQPHRQYWPVRRRQDRVETSQEPVADAISAPPPDVARVLALQQAVGNRSVATLLSRQPVADTLPPIADNLRRFRDGAPRLKALAARTPPVLPTDGFVDIREALAWLRELVDALTVVEPIVDPSMLVFESTVVSGHDAEYGQAETEIRPALADALKTTVPIARELGETIARVVMEQVNRSSVGVAGHDAEPQLAALEDVSAWRVKASALRALAGKVDPGGAGLAQAAHACEDAALALLQARAVLNARATWRADAAQSSTTAQIANPKRPRNEVDDIFADSGFGGRQSLRPKEGTRDDWCGMFVAASMFRGAALDKNVRMAFAHTDNVRDFFSYSRKPVNDARAPLSIWAEGQWWGVREYHEQRGLARRWVFGAAVTGADIRPGDVALIRHKGVKPKGEVANHIVMVDSWDPDTGKLVTIEGNVQEGVRPGADGEPRQTTGGDVASTTTSAPSSTAIHIRDMEDQTTLTPKGAGKGGVYQERGARTVWGIGRPSLVDFEHHEYGLQAIPDDLKYTSPEEMRLKAARRKRLAPTSTIESPATGPYHRRAG